MPERKATVLLEHCLKQLKLPTFLREYAAVAAVCGRENQPFETFLLRLCERELIERQQRATERRIKAATHGHEATYDVHHCALKFDRTIVDVPGDGSFRLS